MEHLNNEFTRKNTRKSQKAVTYNEKKQAHFNDYRFEFGVFCLIFISLPLCHWRSI